MFEISQEFTFDAAHHLAMNVPEGHPYSRLHGHSFSVSLYMRGEPDANAHWLVDFGEVDKAVREVREKLDHRYLNEIKGLEIPTLENISRWIWNEVKPSLPLLHRITIRRGTLGQGCTYEG